METANNSKNGANGNGHRYSFDEFEIDPSNRTCTRAGISLPISGKVYDVLLAFVENPGRLLSKDELIERVWPNEFVEEGNLARNVSSLRKALDDTQKHHRFIVTVPGHGYRFIADVTTRAASILNGQNPSEGEVSTNEHYKLETRKPDVHADGLKSIHTRPVLVFAIVACLVSVMLLAFGLTKPRQTFADTLSFERLRQSALTQDGNVYEPLISPDGNYLAYVRLAGPDRALCLRQISTGSVLELRPPERDISYWALAFSPDGQFLYYILRDKDLDSGSVYRIPVIGQQEPTKIADNANGGLAISPDGQKAVFSRHDRDAGQEYIVTISTSGENEHVIASTDLNSQYFSFDWSPDGQSLLYSKKDSVGNSENWYVAETSQTGGAEVRIGTPIPNAILRVKWLADRSGIVTSAVDEVTKKPQIFIMSYPDGAMRRVTQDQNSYIGFSVTADGKTIAVPQINSSRQIWSIHGSESNQVSSGTEKHFDNVAWKDDENLVFDEDESGTFQNYNIYLTRSDGTNLKQLTFGPGSSSRPTVADDGQAIVYVSNRSGRDELWKMDADGRNATQLTYLQKDVARAVVLPDGKRILFSVFDEGKVGIWEMSIDGAELKQIISPDVFLWAVSPKGDRIAFVTFDRDTKSKVTHVRSIGRDVDDQLLKISPETWLGWGIDGKSLEYTIADDNAANVWTISLDRQNAVPLTAFKDEQVFRFAWSPGGKTLACIRHNTTYDALILHFE